MPAVLALETSCDESAAALVTEAGVVASALASQVEEHARWGGVVPEIASRRHLEALPGLIARVQRESGLSLAAIDAVAATVTPGLVGALLVGSVMGRTLARLHQKPFLGIHHLEGHLCSAWLEGDRPPMPHLVLLVSGGHSELLRVDRPGRYRRLGRSRDDAAGECFDKVARLLGLGYPGGPAIERAALGGDERRFAFPKGRVSLPDGGFHPYDFSFSGLKTAVGRQVRELEQAGGPLPLADLAASFQAVVGDVLVERSLRCAEAEGLDTLVVVGGVAANRRLRERLREQASARGIDWRVAPLAWCTDNAAMIGRAALERLAAGQTSPITLGVAARFPLEEADALYAESPCF
ncbi:MAG: tRNA (adenosine(37)-N6)-threonylcarbamoyltransferase complex transferase subunit TsaD [Cyanobacteria bacterium K_Offshore_surface_m2_239]|nr:tRNA (adenosine(37)-N6)-threonylcarbamoyltransferase complex transferase subunit TsaD [Cyanobacteria bacterium K_Offshore_surface_m2_239]